MIEMQELAIINARGEAALPVCILEGRHGGEKNSSHFDLQTALAPLASDDLEAVCIFVAPADTQRRNDNYFENWETI